MGTALVVGVVVSSVLGGCRGSEPDAATPPTSVATTTSPAEASACDFGPGSGPEKAGGPLQGQFTGLTFGRTYIEPGTLQDAGIVQLLNEGKKPVLVTGVELAPEPHASPLAFTAAFVRDSYGYLEFLRPRHRSVYEPVEGYCLQPTGDSDRPPLLVLRIGPSTHPGRARYSQNNSVDVHYTTPDGRRYVVVYPTVFQYPNAR